MGAKKCGGERLTGIEGHKNCDTQRLRNPSMVNSILLDQRSHVQFFYRGPLRFCVWSWSHGNGWLSSGLDKPKQALTGRIGPNSKKQLFNN